MKTPTNQLRAILAAMLMLIATLPALAYDFEIGDIYYNVLNGTDKHVVTVTSGDNEYSGSITIPPSVTHNAISYSVTEIGRGAFSGCDGLKSITIPNSVTEIGKEAFYGCDSLTSITIPNLVTEIGEAAFAYCTGLTSIIVAKGNSKYDSRNNCNAIIETETNRLIAGCKNTTIPNSVTEIGEAAFCGCTGLTSITIPNSVTEIGEWAFYDCDGLTSITIPNSVTSIGEWAFSACSGLTSIVVAKGNAKYNSRDNCNAIIETETNRLIAGCKNTTIPNSVTEIGDYAFYDCHGLTSITITIPNSVTEIGSGAFSGCSGLTSITIPNSVTSIGEFAFVGCTNLKKIIIQNPDVEIGNNAIPKGVEVIIEK